MLVLQPEEFWILRARPRDGDPNKWYWDKFALRMLPDVEIPQIDDATVLFTSPSAVRAFASKRREAAQHLAIGPSTAAALERAGVRCDAVAAEPIASAIVQRLLELSP